MMFLFDGLARVNVDEAKVGGRMRLGRGGLGQNQGGLRQGRDSP